MISQNNAKQILAYLGLQPSESMVVIGDSTTKGIVQPVYDIVQNSHDVTLINLDKFERPLSSVPDEIVESLKGRELCFYAIDKKANESVNEITFRRELNNLVEEAGGRVGNMLSVTTKVIESAFNHNVQEIKDLTEKVSDYMRKVSAVEVSSKEGTKVIFEFNPEYNWCSSSGFIGKGKRNVMPAEVYTHPATVNGNVVITGTYGLLGSLEQFKDNKKTLDRISKNPIVWVIKDGKIKEVSCRDNEIESIVRKAVFETDENGDRIGEYGMGLNTGIKECLGVMMHDEKYPGVHVAHGHGYPKETGAKYESTVHFDGVLIRPTVLDHGRGKIIMQSGSYKL